MQQTQDTARELDRIISQLNGAKDELADIIDETELNPKYMTTIAYRRICDAVRSLVALKAIQS